MCAKKKTAGSVAKKRAKSAGMTKASRLQTTSAVGNGATATKSKAKSRGAAKPKKLTALAAAARVLVEAGQPMTTRAMIEAMAAKGYWTSPNGQTPASTLYSAITREVKLKGKEARFAKSERGKFMAKA